MDYGWMASLLLTLQSELSDMAGLVRVLLGVLLPGAGYVGRCGRGRCGSAASAARPAPPHCKILPQQPTVARHRHSRGHPAHGGAQPAAAGRQPRDHGECGAAPGHPQHQSPSAPSV